jgi:HAD superfamily hydrolase (TIGR01549 family)
MKEISGVIFDVDGTLTYTNELIFAAFDYLLEKYVGKTYTRPEIVSFWGPTEEVAVGKFIPQEMLPAVMDDYYQFYKSNHQSLAGLHPGMREILEFLKKNNIIIGLFTGKGRRTTDITLDEVGISHYFDMTITGDDVNDHKPSSEGIHKFLDRYSLHPSEVVMVGDAVADIQAARGAGVRVVAAVWDSYAKDEVLQLQVDHVCNTVNELYVWLRDRILNQNQ